MFGFGIPELVILLLVLAPFVLWVVALVDIVKSEFSGNNKIFWLLLVIFIPLLGAILYLMVGRKQRVNPALATALEKNREKFCTDCGKQISPRAEICPHCGVRQQPAIRSGSNPLAVILIVLVVGFGGVAVLGTLAAIAIPQFSAYRVKSYDSAALSDLKNAKTAAESYYADHQEYPQSLEGLSFQPSENVEVTYERVDKDSYFIHAVHKDGNRLYGTTSAGGEIRWRSKDDPGGEFLPLGDSV